MEEKKGNKLLAFFLIIAIIAICIMGYFIYKLNTEKSAEIQKSTDLQSQVNSLNDTVSNLQTKINTINETINDNTINTSRITNKSENNSSIDSSSKISYISYSSSSVRRKIRRMDGLLGFRKLMKSVYRICLGL